MSLQVLAFAMVTYKEVFYKTKAFVMLQKALEHVGDEIKWLVLVYDNTDISTWKVKAPFFSNIELIYYHDPTNPGISVAYNYLSKIALQKGCGWILFSDQDTALPENALSIYLSAIHQFPHVLIKAPITKVGNVTYSPIRYVFRRGRKSGKMEPGIKRLSNYTFINSGIAIQLKFFFEAGGYNENIKLDFADFVFLDKVRKKTDFFEVLPIWPIQSFSFLEHNKLQALKRYEIFVKDLAQCPRTGWIDILAYSSFGWTHMLKLSVKYKTFAFAKVWWLNR